MVTTNEIMALLESYLGRNRMDNAEAMYMWARSIQEDYLSSTIRIRYGGTEAVDSIQEDLQILGIKSQEDSIEDTNQNIAEVIEEGFGTHYLPVIIKLVKEKISDLSPIAKKILYVIYKMDLSKPMTALPREIISDHYRKLYSEDLTDFLFSAVIVELLKHYFFDYLDKDANPVFPPYVKALMPKSMDIEIKWSDNKLKVLPSVHLKVAWSEESS